MNKKIALDNLIALDGIFRKNKSEYWLSCGTLLGLHRNGDFIGHDRDTDVCVNITSLNRGLIDDLRTNGFEINRKYGRYEDGFEMALVKCNVKTDIFFFYKSEEKWYHSVYANFTNIDSVKYDYVFDPFGLKETEFLGHVFFTPDDIESVIVQQYGEDWKIPNENWSYYKSPKNVINTNKRIFNKDTEIDFINI